MSLVDDFFEDAQARDVLIDMPAGPFNDSRRSLIHGDLKLTVSNESRRELYDLSKDPGERDNLWEPSDLPTRLKQWTRATRSPRLSFARFVSPGSPESTKPSSGGPASRVPTLRCWARRKTILASTAFAARPHRLGSDACYLRQRSPSIWMAR